jgi:hypothetical protein
MLSILRRTAYPLCYTNARGRVVCSNSEQAGRVQTFLWATYYLGSSPRANALPLPSVRKRTGSRRPNRSISRPTTPVQPV